MGVFQLIMLQAGQTLQRALHNDMALLSRPAEDAAAHSTQGTMLRC